MTDRLAKILDNPAAEFRRRAPGRLTAAGDNVDGPDHSRIAEECGLVGGCRTHVRSSDASQLAFRSDEET
jgi:hypothetical protein